MLEGNGLFKISGIVVIFVKNVFVVKSLWRCMFMCVGFKYICFLIGFFDFIIIIIWWKLLFFVVLVWEFFMGKI